MKRHPSYVKGDICNVPGCGNKAHPSTGYCSDCVPPLVSPSLTVTFVRCFLGWVVGLFQMVEA
jgi:hypothetical protein